MMPFSAIETPAVLVDETIAHANITTYQAYCDEHQLALRPHIKTHKLPHLAKAQLRAGAIGITCQKISEAEVMAQHGISDILITYNILGASKLSRLVKLSESVDQLAVVADNERVIAGLADAFSKVSRPLDVLIECDTGAGRCGAQSVEETVALAQRVTIARGLRLRGLMTYPAVGGSGAVQKFLTEACASLRAQNIECPVVSSGGSPDMWNAHSAPIVNEYRVGTYIYNDRSLLKSGTCKMADCALTVLATVVSTPTPKRAVMDAGSKILTTDLNGFENYGAVTHGADLIVSALSEEHGILTSTNGGQTALAVGDRVQIIPNHCCVVSNMVDRVILHQHREQFEVVPVAARGCIT